MKNRFKIIWISCFALVCLLHQAMAESLAPPLQMLQSVSSQMLNYLEQHKSQLRSSHSRTIIQQMVNRILVPHIAVNEMAASVIGPNWRQTNQAQRSEFIRLFSRLVISTYSDALSSYDGDRINFYPLRAWNEAKQRTTVHSQIVRRNGQKISINYRLIKIGEQWKIDDFSIENVSMVQNYREQLAPSLHQGGMDQLLNRLRIHDQEQRK